MAHSKSQQQILQRLKTRGPQSVKILSNQLDMTTMGVRQHLAELARRELVEQTSEARQTRGRPVHLWKLTQQGHARFPDGHSQVTLELIDVIREDLGDDGLDRLIAGRSHRLQQRYQSALEAAGPDLQQRLETLAQLRSEEGYMAEVRLVPDGWLLIENHCPICAAAERCQQFCRTELEMFQQLLAGAATVNRVDHLLAGARRCAYKVSPQPTS
jgi:predicted ArsR family transcriptional regulator